ncbi:hypothetical protein [Marivita hallyeonensis]|uniref:hypothetical protein n=1 Tax=Marivita hallyeonensis TaxID=996342 RepID=UPI00116064EB|nr:hypothetical protein [Marivita hallyeonensis]
MRQLWVSIIGWIDSHQTERRVVVVCAIVGVLFALASGIYSFVYPGTSTSIAADTQRTAGAAEQIAEEASALREDVEQGFQSTLAATENLSEATLQGKREVSQDPVTQLANWGYQMGQFESSEALFVRVLVDGNPSVIRTALNANVTISPTLFLDYQMPEEVYPDLAAHQNWRGNDLCTSTEILKLDLVQLEKKHPKNFEFLEKYCSDAVHAIALYEKQRKREIEEEKKRAEEFRLAQIKLEREMQEKRERELKKERRAAEKAIKPIIDDCLKYYNSQPYRREVEAALVAYIETGFSVWEPKDIKDYRFPSLPSGIYVKEWDISSYASPFSWLRSYAQGGHLVVRDGKLSFGKSTRITSVDHAYKNTIGHLANYLCNLVSAKVLE